MLNKERIYCLLEYQKWQSSYDSSAISALKRFFVCFRRTVLLFKNIYALPETQECDILFLNPSAKNLYRTQPLCDLLVEKGLDVHSAVLPSPFEAIKKRLLTFPDKNIPLSLKFYASYARHIVKRFRPKIVITFMDNSLFSPFLRYELKNFGKVINIAHGYTASTKLFSMIDFDYYFLFGQKSFQELRQNKVRFGNTNVVLTGSPFVDRDFTLPKIRPNKNILFFSSWINHENRDLCLKNFEIVFNWTKANPDYTMFIKLHPTEDNSYWTEKSKELKNLFVFDGDTPIVEALRDISLTIIQWSSAAIESALLQRPFVVVNDSDMPDGFLQAERFFPTRAKNTKTLDERIHQVLHDYNNYLTSCKQFVSLHLEHKQSSREYIVDCIEKIFHNNSVPSIPLSEKIDTLYK